MGAGRIAISERQQIRFCRDSEAAGLLEDPAFGLAWDELAAACPWATAAQSRLYAGVWYGVYSQVFELMLVYRRAETGALSGLLALARHRQDGRLTLVGDLQGEYKTWLARPDDGDGFIEDAMDELARQLPGGRLCFQYLPAGAPLGWLSPGRRWASRTRLVRCDRPLMWLGEGSTVAESLAKKGNKSRLARLARIGPLELEVFASRQALEPCCDELISYYDLRQEAVNQCAPFREDPLKREFYLRLQDHPDLLHGSVLRAGAHIIAAHFGLRNRDSVQFGIVIHSPFLASHSPGKWITLKLGQQLAAEGYAYLDLTPGGDQYKTRFASHTTQVHVLTVFFHAAQARRAALRSAAVRLVKKALPRLGVTSQRARALAAACTGGRLWRRASRWLWDSHDVLYFALARPAAPVAAPDPPLHRDAIADMLLYEPSGAAASSRAEFLSTTLSRLEGGAHVYSATAGRTLLHHAWLDRINGDPPNSLLLWDDCTHPATPPGPLYQAALSQRLSDAAVMEDIEWVFLAAPSGDRITLRHIAAAGFESCGRLVRQTRFGRRRQRWAPARQSSLRGVPCPSCTK